VTKLEFGWRLPTYSTDGSPGARTLEQNAEWLRRLEPHVDTVWVQDHLVPEAAWANPSWDSYEAWSTLAYLAGAFPHYTFGTIVLANSFRSPALLAKMAATVQNLSGGRLILGLGAGWHEAEYRAYGFDYPSPATRIRQLEEAVQIIRAMWTQSPASFEGKHYRIENAYCEPKPNPAPPIMIGGGGEQLTLRVVARYADWYNTPGSPVEVVQRKLEVLRGYCQEIGRDFDAMPKTATLGTVAIAKTRDEAQRMAEASPFYNPAQPTAAVIGTPDDAVEQLRKFSDLGVSHINVRFADFPRFDGATRFFEEVVPKLRAAGM
jgi:alkanesulfonate monooxygenase SsuD/methylene tetrahydromethanopterin reductase-like flavin-dependent oxidoreductase (luciferase family)